MIILTQKVTSIPLGTKVRVLRGGFGAGIAANVLGVTVVKPVSDLTWPEYAGVPVEDAVLFVKRGKRLHDLWPC